jgi:hypothetical protein
MKHFIWAFVLLATILLVALTSCSPRVAATVPPSPADGRSTDPAMKSSGKLSSRLAILAQSTSLQTASIEEQALALSLPAQGAGSLVRDETGRLLVNIRMTDTSDSQQQALVKAGAVIQHVTDQYKTVSAFVAVTDLAAVAGIQTVQSIEEELTPSTADGANGGAMNPSQP